MSASRCNGGMTYGVTSVSIVSVQSVKAVASIVLGLDHQCALDHHYACLESRQYLQRLAV